MTSTPRAKRHNLYFLSVFDARSGAFLGQLSDISTEGVSILSEVPLQFPASYFLRILVPQSDRPDLRLEFEAESRWTNQDPGMATGSPSHTTGFRIGVLTDEQRGQIEKLVHDFGYAKISEIKVAPRPQAPPPGGLRRLLQTLFNH